MKQLTCEICGSTDLVKQDGLFVCQSCGTKYSVEEARKMVSDEDPKDVVTVKVDRTDELKNLYAAARRAKNDNNAENAIKYYEQILIKDPSSWEAAFYTVFFAAKDCRLMDVYSKANAIANCENTVFSLIHENVKDSNEERAAVQEVATQSISMATLLFDSYRRYYLGIANNIKKNFVQGYANACSACRDILYKCGDGIYNNFGDKYGDIAVSCWELGVKQHSILYAVFIDKRFNANVINSYVAKIKRFKTSYAPPAKGGACYVATAIYGSYDCPEVWILRRYRDYYLAPRWWGKVFIKVYYSVSPFMLKIFGNNTLFVRLIRNVLDHMLDRLRKCGYSDMPYEDK